MAIAAIINIPGFEERPIEVYNLGHISFPVKKSIWFMPFFRLYKNDLDILL